MPNHRAARLRTRVVGSLVTALALGPGGADGTCAAIRPFLCTRIRGPATPAETEHASKGE